MPNNHTIIKLRRGTAAEWIASNEILKLGEPGFEVDTFKLKIGNGILAWNDLPYISGGMGGDNGPLQYSINGLYLVTNIDGTVLSSTNGIDWSAPFDTTIEPLGKFTIGPSKIVYTRCDIEEDTIDTGLYFSALWNEIPTLAPGTDNYYFNEVHYLNNLYIAVGFTTDSPRRPIHAYSSDAINWTVLEADETFCNSIAGVNDFKFNDIGYNGTGYFIISSISGLDNGGGFYILDITQPVSGDQWVSLSNFPSDSNQLVYFGGDLSWGKWSAFSDDKKTWWATSNEDPSQEWGFIDGWNLSNTIFNEATGLDDLTISEATIGVLKDSIDNYYVTWMVSTNQGQIIWWPNVPAGPFVSVPKPYTATIATIEELAQLTVTVTGITGTPINNEKIKISGATGLPNLNGEYFVEEIIPGVTYKLHTSIDLNNPVDASGWSGTYVENSATATLSRGTFIDALGYGNNKFFAANDREEIFVCSLINSNGNLVWTEVDNRDNDFAYWNDINFGALGSGNSDMIIDLNSNQIKLNEISNNINFSNYFDFIKDNNYAVTLRITNIDDGSFEIFMSNTVNYSEPYYVFDITKIVNNNLSYENDSEYYVNIDIIGAGGSLSIPVANIDLHNGGVQSAQVLQFDNVNKQSVITGPTPATDTNAQRLILQGQKGQGNGEGGDVYVWGGDGDTNGGDIKIYAGDADNNASGNGGYVNIDGGDGYTQGGSVSINGGNSSTNGGDINITGGSPSGVVNISSNDGSYNWIFNSNGELELSTSGLKFSDNSTQTTAASNIVDDALNTSLVAGNGIDLNYDSGTNTLSISTTKKSYTLFRETTDDTGNIVLTTDGNAPSGSNQLNIAATTTWNFNIQLSAYDSTNNTGSSWNFRGCLRRNDSPSEPNTILVGSVIEENYIEYGALSANVYAETSPTDGLSVRVTGLASTTIKWIANVDIVESSYN